MSNSPPAPSDTRKLVEEARAAFQCIWDLPLDGNPHTYISKALALSCAGLEISHRLAAALEASPAVAGEDEIARLEKLVYVPGMLRCAKCGCVLITTNLHADSGRFSANNDPQQCPNGCGPMWRRTEREAGNDLGDRLEAMHARATKAEAAGERMAKLEAAFERVLTGVNHIATYRTELWPAVGTAYAVALERLGAGREYDMWCCWNATMLAREALAALPESTGEREGEEK